jgi:hypothetical protein
LWRYDEPRHYDDYRSFEAGSSPSHGALWEESPHCFCNYKTMTSKRHKLVLLTRFSRPPSHPLSTLPTVKLFPLVLLARNRTLSASIVAMMAITSLVASCPRTATATTRMVILQACARSL